MEIKKDKHSITTEQVQKVAKLARLELSEEELTLFTGQLDTILAYVEQLDELETEEVEGTSHAVPLICPLREDRPAPSSTREAIVENAPDHDQGCFRVPRIID